AMDIILLIGVAFAFFLALLLMVRKEKHLSDKILAAFFVIIGLTILLAWFDFYNRQNNYPLPALLGLSTPLILLHGPCLWFYIKSLTTKKMSFRPWWLFHFVPFVLVAAMMTIGYFSLPVDDKIAMEQQNLISKDPVFYVVVGMIALVSQAYYIWGLVLIRNYKKKLKSYFSDIQKLRLSWLRILLIYAIVFYAVISLIYIADAIFHLFDYHNLQLMGFSVAALFNILIGFQGIRHGDIFAETPVRKNLEQNKPTPSPKDKPESQEERFVQQLLEYMQKEKPWLEPDLTIASLSRQLGVNSDYLSRIINSKLNRNFFDFVNYYRIEAFKSACRDKENNNYTIMGMAYDAGFNSKATFNRVFKNATGHTPGEYYREVKSDQ
ncbi:MAG: helix-turn-helix domain-containing protein, partial [Bacteroidales bacterium]